MIALIILVWHFATSISAYSMIIIDLLPLAKRINLFPASVRFPLLLFLPTAFPYFFISLIIYILFSPSKIYAFIIPFIAIMAESYLFYKMDGWNIFLSYNGLMITHVARFVLAIVLSYLGAILGKYIKRRAQHLEAYIKTSKAGNIEHPDPT